jgi:hypothetical protein
METDLHISKKEQEQMTWMNNVDWPSYRRKITKNLDEQHGLIYRSQTKRNLDEQRGLTFINSGATKTGKSYD